MVFFDGSWAVLNKIYNNGTTVSYDDNSEFFLIMPSWSESGPSIVDFTKTLQARTIKFII